MTRLRLAIDSAEKDLVVTAALFIVILVAMTLI